MNSSGWKCFYSLILAFVFSYHPTLGEVSTTFITNSSVQTAYHLNRTKRQISLSKDPHVNAWRKIYFFSVRLARAMGNNGLVWNMNEMARQSKGQVKRAYTYGYYRSRGRGCGCGCGGGGGAGYGGYPMTYAMQPIYYYVPMNTAGQQVIPIDGINDFTGNFGNALSNEDLLNQLIEIINEALGQTYTYYYQTPDNGGGDNGGGDYPDGGGDQPPDNGEEPEPEPTQ